MDYQERDDIANGAFVIFGRFHEQNHRITDSYVHYDHDYDDAEITNSDDQMSDVQALTPIREETQEESGGSVLTGVSPVAAPQTLRANPKEIIQTKSAQMYEVAKQKMTRPPIDGTCNNAVFRTNDAMQESFFNLTRGPVNLD